MRITEPEFLLLLPALLWFWRGRRNASSATAPRRHLRVAVVACLILALSGVQIRLGEAPLAAMFVVDESGSMGGTRADLVQDVRTLASGMRAGDRAGLVRFGATATVERRLATRFDPSGTVAASIGTMTNIEAALRVGRASLPSEGERRLVLISDGRETHGAAALEAARAAAANIPIDVVIPEPLATTPIDVMQVTAPATARVGDSFAVTVIARGTPSTQGTITLTTPGDTRIANVTLDAAGFAASSFSLRADDPGIKVYEAAAQATDVPREFASQSRRAGAVVSVSGETHVLHVRTTPGRVAPLLRGSGFRVSEIVPQGLSRAASALATYDVIVLDAIRPDDLQGVQASALRAYIERHGGGILFLGTRDNLDAGTLASTAIGELLPIDVRPRGGQRAPALGLVVAFDKSGSMDDRVDGVPRIEFARLAVRRVFEAVPASDAVGVLAFDSTAHVVAPLRSGHDAALLASSLRAIQPSGATAIAPAIETAAQWLRDATGVRRRHVLLVSDGRTSAADLLRAQLILGRREFELSVVALGADADRQALESLAAQTGGRAYFPADIRDLPAIVARESARVAGGRLFEQSFTPRVRAHPLVAGVSAPLPPLGGYVVSAAKPSAEVALQSPLEDPILATWRLGLGRVAAYTADLNGPWSARLRSWDGFTGLLAQMVRSTSRSLRHDAIYARIDEDSDGLRVIVELDDVDILTDLRCRANVRTPKGDAVDLPLQRVAPGRYEARLDTSDPGAYVFAISGESRDGSIDARVVRGAYWSADREYRQSDPDVPFLTTLAETSGGRVLHRGESVFASPRGSTYFDLWRWLALAALLLFVAELLLPILPHLPRFAGRPDQRRHAREAA